MESAQAKVQGLYANANQQQLTVPSLTHVASELEDRTVWDKTVGVSDKSTHASSMPTPLGQDDTTAFSDGCSCMNLEASAYTRRGKQTTTTKTSCGLERNAG